MKRLIDRIRAERGAEAVPAEAQVIIGDDVLAGIDRQTEDRQWTAADFPNIAPPFAHTFIEARSLLAARELKAEYIMGLHIADSTQQMWNRRTVPDGQVRHPATKWILTLFGWSFIDRVLFQYPGFAFIHVAEDGRWLDDAQNVQCYIDTRATGGVTEDHALYAMGFLPLKDLMNALPFAFMTLSLLHCKNVSLRQQLPPGAEARKFRKKHGVEMSRFHTLTIRPTGSRMAREARPGSDPLDLRAQHIRRGHFRTYTPEAPLFGKWTGTYFVAAHVVGDRELGTVDKRYRVQP